MLRCHKRANSSHRPRSGPRWTVPRGGLKSSIRRKLTTLTRTFNFIRARLPFRASAAAPQDSSYPNCSTILDCRAFFRIPLQWVCFSVALFYVAYGGLWLAYSLNYMYDLAFFNQECKKLDYTPAELLDQEFLQKCADLEKAVTARNGEMSENQAINFGSNFLFGIFTVNMGLILLCGSKTRNQYLVLTFLIGEMAMHVIFYFMYFLFRFYWPTSNATDSSYSSRTAWYVNPISGVWRILWEWVLVWIVFAYFVQLCKEEATEEGDSIFPMHLVQDLPKIIQKLLDFKANDSLGKRKLRKVNVV